MTSVCWFYKQPQRWGYASMPQLGNYEKGTLVMYEYMQGKMGNGKYFGIPQELGGGSTIFPLAGDPILRTGFIDGETYTIEGKTCRHWPGDRRLGVSSGPFTMVPGDTQEVVYCQIAALGKDRLNAIRILKAFAKWTQDKYPSDFQPDKIPRISSTELRESKFGAYDELILEWNYNNVENYSEQGYEFQGYNIYQFYSDIVLKENALRVATIDKNDGITEIIGTVLNLDTGEENEGIIQYGSDSGIQRKLKFSEDFLNGSYLIKGKPYYYGISAYAVKEDSGDKFVVESPINMTKIEYQFDMEGPSYGDTILTKRVSGDAEFKHMVTIVDPSKLNGHEYNISLNDPSDGFTWNLVDVTDNEVISSNIPFWENWTLASAIVDGIKVKVWDGVSNISYPSGFNLSGSGSYDWEPFGIWGLTGSSKGINAYGRGTNDQSILKKDYEFRFTGEYDNETQSIRYIKTSTGSNATIIGASNYSLSEHPMNPNPGSDTPFMIRIPFEVWNIDDDQQINLLIFDREQNLGDDPFYSFSSHYKMYFHLLNTPYSEAAVDTSSVELNNLTWSFTSLECDWVIGDKMEVIFRNPITEDDILSFSTEKLEKSMLVPEVLELFHNYPNPFNASTTIRFFLPEKDQIKVNVYNILGQRVKELVNREMEAGKYEVQFNGNNIASGVYIVRLENSVHSESRKMVLVK